MSLSLSKCHLLRFSLLRLLCVSIDLPYGIEWNTVVMPGLVLVAATCKCQMCYKNRYGYATSLENLAHHRNVVSLSLFYSYYFGRFSSELAQLVPLPYSRGRSTCYSHRLYNFSVTICRCYKDVYVNSFFPHTARLWNSLPIECFPLTYDLDGFKPRINRHLLTVGSF